MVFCEAHLRTLTLFLLPLFRCEALWRPRMYGCDLFFERIIHKSMSHESCLFREQR